MLDRLAYVAVFAVAFASIVALFSMLYLFVGPVTSTVVLAITLLFTPGAVVCWVIYWSMIEREKEDDSL